MNNSVIDELQVNEHIIDKFIDTLNFQSSVIDVRNFINWTISLNQIKSLLQKENKNVEQNIDSLSSVYTYLKERLNSDVSKSLIWDGYDESYNKTVLSEILILCKYKMLYNILPLIYRKNKNIYNVVKVNDTYSINFLDDIFFKYECFDILFTRLSVLVNFNNISNDLSEIVDISNKFFNKSGFNISYNEQIIIYKKFVKIYIEEYSSLFYLLSDSFLEPVGGFSLKSFKHFFAGCFVINQFCNEMVICFSISNNDLVENEKVHELLIKNIYNRKENYEVFRDFFCNLTDLDVCDFESIIRYFMIDYDGEATDLSGDEYIVPFVKKDNVIYFNSIFNVQVVHPRNLIYSMNSLSNKILKDTKYDSVSKELERNLIAHMRRVFESYGLTFFEEKKWSSSKKNKGEIDSIVVCKKNKKIMLIQTKTVISASNYRTLFSLQDNMMVAIEQLKRFDQQDKEFKNKFLSDLIGVDITDYEIFHCLNSDGGLGNALIWENIFDEGFVPFNVGVIILYFNRFSTLENFKENMYQLIEELNEKTNPKLINCKMDYSSECGALPMIHNSCDANYLNLIEEIKIIHKKLQSL